MIELIDSHCHLDFPVFDADRSELISRCVAAGIKEFIVPGVEAASWDRLVQLRKQFPNIHIAFGLHPYFIEQHKPEDLNTLRQYCQQYSPVAIGEIGLDFYRKDLPRDKQHIFFQQQLSIAEEFRLPVILHVRKAHQDVMSYLKQFKLTGGIAHAFNGSFEQAQQYIGLGFKLGFGGALTYPNATRLQELARQLPLESLVLETDSPDMKPVGSQESRNTPLTLLLVLDQIARLKKLSSEETAQVLRDNLKSIIPG